MASVQSNWKSLGTGIRASLIVGIVVIAAFTIAAFWWLTSEAYHVLFTDMEPRDAAKVVTQLEEMKVDYRLANGGTQIRVPASSVHEIRLKLMGSDVPLVGGVGFEIFNDSNFGMTEFSQRINYQRALEGELTRTVVSLKEVKYARVHLVMPERGLFQQNDNEPTASVTLFLQGDHQPTSRRILGIQRLVASAVPGLSANQVTVTDQNGMTLSQQISDQGVAAVSGRLQQKQAVETYLVNKANEVLERNFGVQRAMVSIDATLEFNQVKRTRENVVPLENQSSSGIVRRRETRMGAGAKPDKGRGNVTTEVEYRLGRSVEQIVETPGRIVRLSLGIMVPPGTSDAERQSIADLVKMAVGFNTTRGDVSAIYAMGEPMPAVAAQQTGPAQTAPVESETWTGDAQSSVSDDSQMRTVPEAGRRTEIPFQWVSDQIDRYPVVVPGLMAFGVLMLIALAVRLARKPKHSAVLQLSTADRQQALEDIRSWLDGADAATKSEVV